MLAELITVFARYPARSAGPQFKGETAAGDRKRNTEFVTCHHERGTKGGLCLLTRIRATATGVHGRAVTYDTTRILGKFGVYRAS